jgi:hypothetical protein
VPEEPVTEAEVVPLAYATPETTDTRPRTYPGVRAVCVVLGVGYPFAGVVLNQDPSEVGVPVAWQNGATLAWVTLVPMIEVLWPFVPLLLYGWASMAYAAVTPRGAAASAVARVGLLVGVAVGVQFTFIVAAGMGEGRVSATAGALLGQVFFGILATAAVLAVTAALHEVPWHRLHRSARRTIVVVVVGSFVVGIVFLGHAIFYLALLGTMVAAPASIVAFLAMLFFVRRAADEAEMPVWSPPWIGLLLLFVANVLAWLISYRLAQAAYAKLPTASPACFVATAAAKAAESRRTHHRQLAILRAYEVRLRTRHPTLHRKLRRRYDVVGPWLAAHVTTPRRAAVVHALLSPLAWAVRS